MQVLFPGHEIDRRQNWPVGTADALARRGELPCVMPWGENLFGEDEVQDRVLEWSVLKPDFLESLRISENPGSVDQDVVDRTQACESLASSATDSRVEDASSLVGEGGEHDA